MAFATYTPGELSALSMTAFTPVGCVTALELGLMVKVPGGQDGTTHKGNGQNEDEHVDNDVWYAISHQLAKRVVAISFEFGKRAPISLEISIAVESGSEFEGD